MPRVGVSPALQAETRSRGRLASPLPAGRAAGWVSGASVGVRPARGSKCAGRESRLWFLRGVGTRRAQLRVFSKQPVPGAAPSPSGAGGGGGRASRSRSLPLPETREDGCFKNAKQRAGQPPRGRQVPPQVPGPCVPTPPPPRPRNPPVSHPRCPQRLERVRKRGDAAAPGGARGNERPKRTAPRSPAEGARGASPRTSGTLVPRWPGPGTRPRAGDTRPAGRPCSRTDAITQLATRTGPSCACGNPDSARTSGCAQTYWMQILTGFCFHHENF